MLPDLKGNGPLYQAAEYHDIQYYCTTSHDPRGEWSYFFPPLAVIIPPHLPIIVWFIRVSLFFKHIRPTLQGSKPDMSVEERKEGAECTGTPNHFLKLIVRGTDGASGKQNLHWILKRPRNPAPAASAYRFLLCLLRKSIKLQLSY